MNISDLSNYFTKGLFSNHENCLKFLVELKWKNGYCCKKCTHHKFGNGRKRLNRRCLKCRYDESPTAGTLFHKIKFPLNEAFEIVYLLSQLPEGVSSCELSRNFNICQKTAWFFKRKIQQSCAKFENEQIHENQGSVIPVGQNLNIKMLLEQRLGRDCEIQFESKGSLVSSAHFNRTFRIKSIWADKTEEKTDVKTKLIHSRAFGGRWLNHLHQSNSLSGESTPQVREMIRNWIKETHIHISRKHLFYYCSELAFRYRNRTQIDRKIPFFKLLKAMTIHPWLSFKRIAAT
jgi:hypothetical protein